MSSQKLGQLIRFAREADPFWTQKELAQKAAVATETIHRAEHDGNIGVRTLAKIARALDEKTGGNLLEQIGLPISVATTVQSQPTDTPGATPARGPSEPQGSAGVTDEHWEDLKGIYRTAARGLDEHGRKQLVDAIEELALRFKRERVKEGAKRASGE